jgi:hypothetical protein
LLNKIQVKLLAVKNRFTQLTEYFSSQNFIAIYTNLLITEK